MSDRYNRGLENFRRITSQAGKGLTDTFDKTALDLERYLMEFVFGDTYPRPVFAGFPAATNAMVIAKQVFADRAASKR